MLAASGITDEQIIARGYRTITDADELESLNIPLNWRQVPGLWLPGSQQGRRRRRWAVPSRRAGARGSEIISPKGQHNYLDVPAGWGDQLDDPSVPAWITEGAKKSDAAAAHGLLCLSSNGVYGWRGSNSKPGKTAPLKDWDDVLLAGRDVVIAFDGDVQRKDTVRSASTRSPSSWSAGARRHVLLVARHRREDRAR